MAPPMDLQASLASSLGLSTSSLLFRGSQRHDDRPFEALPQSALHKAESSASSLNEYREWKQIDQRLIQEALHLVRTNDACKMAITLMMTSITEYQIRLSEQTQLEAESETSKWLMKTFLKDSALELRMVMEYMIALGFCVVTWRPDPVCVMKLSVVDLQTVTTEIATNSLHRPIVRCRRSDGTQFGNMQTKDSRPKYDPDRSVKKDNRYREPVYSLWMTNPPESNGALTSPAVAMVRHIHFADYVRSAYQALTARYLTPQIFVAKPREKANEESLHGTDVADSMIPRCPTGNFPGAASSASAESAAAAASASHTITAINNRNAEIAKNRSIYGSDPLADAAQQERFRSTTLQSGAIPYNVDRPIPLPDSVHVTEAMHETVFLILGLPMSAIKQIRASVISKATDDRNTADKLLYTVCKNWAYGVFAPIIEWTYTEGFLKWHYLAMASTQIRIQQKRNAKTEATAKRKERIRKAVVAAARPSTAAAASIVAASPPKSSSQSSSSASSSSSSSSDDESEVDEKDLDIDEIPAHIRYDRWSCTVQFLSFTKFSDVEKLVNMRMMTYDKAKAYASELLHVSEADLDDQPENGMELRDEPYWSNEQKRSTAKLNDARAAAELEKLKAEREHIQLDREKLKFERESFDAELKIRKAESKLAAVASPPKGKKKKQTTKAYEFDSDVSGGEEDYERFERWMREKLTRLKERKKQRKNTPKTASAPAKPRKRSTAAVPPAQNTRSKKRRKITTEERRRASDRWANDEINND